MAFCANCGFDIKDARFCPSCGTPVGGAATAGQAEVPQPAQAEPVPQPASQPRTVTMGQVKKCPSCGAPVESFQSRCSSCGHEFGSIQVSDAIKEFSAQINSLDEKIANEKGYVENTVADKPAVNKPAMPSFGNASSRRTSSRSRSSPLNTSAASAAGALLGSSLKGQGSSSSTVRRPSSSSSSGSGTGKSIAGGVLIVGILVGAIVLIVKIIKNFKNAIARPALSSSEKIKKSYIENYVIPNNREDMLEFVLLASSKAESVIDLGHGETMGELASAHYWAKVWENKCRKVEDRAFIALQGDSQTISQINRFHDRSKEAYRNITKAKKKAQVKSIILFVFMLVAIAVIATIVVSLLFTFFF